METNTFWRDNRIYIELTILISILAYFFPGPVLSVLLLWGLFFWGYAPIITALNHSGHVDLHDIIRDAQEKASKSNSHPKVVCVIGSGLSGVQAMKACLEHGLKVVCYERYTEVGGFWNYSEDPTRASVYRSTHIDTDRDLNSFGDFPWNPQKPLLITNPELLSYLRENAQAFNLKQHIRFQTDVELVTPVFVVTAKGEKLQQTDLKSRAREGDLLTEEQLTAIFGTLDFVSLKKQEKVLQKWKVVSHDYDAKTGRRVQNSRAETIFDGVMVCTGRHGHSGYIPAFPGMEKFRGEKMHSSQYKYPEKHNIVGQTVAVVGVGNSGIDIVTEVSQKAKKTFLVSRSGAWITKTNHGDITFAAGVQSYLQVNIFFRLPWWTRSTINERVGLAMSPTFEQEQAILNKHGLKPKHRFWQQHTLVSGLGDPEHTLHDELKRGHIEVKHGVAELTENGLRFSRRKDIEDPDSPIQVEDEVTPVDTVIFATGFKQAANFVDRRVVDMDFDRVGNDVILYHMIFPICHYQGLGFINFVQSASFLCAELQSRLFCQVLSGVTQLPPLEEQRKWTLDTRQTLCSQFLDRQQLRVQEGIHIFYYDALARAIGCFPSPLALLVERPTCFWHVWLTPWAALQYRMVGPGRLENAEKKVEELYNSRFWGNLPNGTPRAAPRNRGSIWALVKDFVQMAFLVIYLCFLAVRGYHVGGDIKDQKEQNLWYLSQGNDKLEHSLELGQEAKDVAALGGRKLGAYVSKDKQK